MSDSNRYAEPRSAVSAFGVEHVSKSVRVLPGLMRRAARPWIDSEELLSIGRLGRTLGRGKSGTVPDVKVSPGKPRRFRKKRQLTQGERVGQRFQDNIVKPLQQV